MESILSRIQGSARRLRGAGTVNPRLSSGRLKLRTLGLLRAPLATLARLAGTDKIDSHEYIAAYERFLSEYRHRRLNLLEIGVGGYESSPGGCSLNLWEAYFRRGTIVGIDVHDKRFLSHGRVHVHQCSQTDAEGLRKLSGDYGGFDLIIDDGSHWNEHQIETFEVLFPLLKTPGVYAIEDIQSSYWPAFGGGIVGTPEHRRSAMAYFAQLADKINYAEYLPRARVAPTYLQLWVRGIYFEHNLIVITKGDNSAPSNLDLDAIVDKLG